MLYNNKMKTLFVNLFLFCQYFVHSFQNSTNFRVKILDNTRNVIQGVYRLSEGEIGIFIEDEYIYTVNTSNNIKKISLVNSTEVLHSFNLVSGLNNVLIASCTDYLLSFVDQNFNVVGTPIKYDKINKKEILGKTNLILFNDILLFIFGLFESKQLGVQINLFKIDFDQLSFIHKASLNIPIYYYTEPSDFISCQLFASGECVACGFVTETKRLYIGATFSPFTSINNFEINFPTKGVNLIKLTENFLCLVSYYDRIRIEFLTIEGQFIYINQGIFLSFAPTLKSFTSTKKDDSTIFLAQIEDADSFLIHIITYIEDYDIINTSFRVPYSTKEIKLISFDYKTLVMIIKEQDNDIKSIIVDLPECIDTIYVELYSGEEIIFPLYKLSEDTTVKVGSVSASSGEVSITPDHEIQYIASDNGDFSIDYTLNRTKPSMLSSKPCRIHGKVCNDLCNKCSKFSSNNSEPFCITCPNDYYHLPIDKFKCFQKNEKVDGFYYNYEFGIFEKCHFSCLSCNGPNENNCLSCKENYIYDVRSGTCDCEKKKNLWYSQGNRAICTEKCPYNLPYLNNETNECITSCQRRVYQSKCVEECPRGTKVYNSICRTSPSSVDEVLTIIDENLLEFYYLFPVGFYQDSSYAIYKYPEEKNEKYQNMSSVFFEKCANIILQKTEIFSLFIFQVDYFKEDMISNQVEYIVYSDRGKRLNLSFCENETLIILSPILKQNLEKINYDSALRIKDIGYNIYNSSDPFYNDICIPYTSEDSTDISLDLRQKLFYLSVPLCEQNCEYQEIDLKRKEIQCICKVKQHYNERTDTTLNNKFNSDFRTHHNFGILKCYKILLKGVAKNLGFWIFTLIFSIELISLLIYYKIGSDTLASITYRALEKTFSIDSSFSLQNRSGTISNLCLQHKTFESMGLFTLNDAAPPPSNLNNLKKNKALIVKKLTSISEVRENREENRKIKQSKTFIQNNNFLEDIDFTSQNNEDPNQNNFPLRNKAQGSLGSNSMNQNFNHDINRDSNLDVSRKKARIIRIPTALSNISIKKHPKYTDEELNLMNFMDSLENDKRSFTDIYISLLKYKQIIYFSFKLKDFNIQIIKTSLFFFVITLLFWFNLVVFTKNTLERIYYSQGSYDFFYFIGRILYSTIFSCAIYYLLCLCVLSHPIIIKLKNSKETLHPNEKIHLFFRMYKFRVMVFFLFEFLVIFLVWYYMSCFCVIYSNSQRHLFINVTISFIICNIYPILFCFNTTVFRLFALRSKSRVFFTLSKASQFF